MMQPESLKFIIYHSDNYYPSATEYDDYTTAMRDFSKLKSRRIEEAEMSEDPFFEKDYLCIVLSEIDVEALKELSKLVKSDECD